MARDRQRQKQDRPDRPARPGRTPHRPARASRNSGQNAGSEEKPLLWGFHTVREALRSPRRTVTKVMATRNAASRLQEDLSASGLEADIVDASEIEARLPRDAVHQGVLAEALPLEPIALQDLPGDGFVLVLDQVTDPHNVGAIVRTAAAFALDAIVTTERHSPALTGVLAKSASGGLEHVPLVQVVNLARALETLGDMGYLRLGLDSEGPEDLRAVTLARPLALVLGAEGKGLRRLSRENCDVLARLDMPGPIKSLNVSNACAVALALACERLGTV